MNLTEDDRRGLVRKLRRSSTDAEKRLWGRLRNRQLCGLKFKRQVPVCGFCADFFCEDAKLIVEVDGGQHAVRTKKDAERTKVLESAGFQVLRFWNNDVLPNIEGVLQEIANIAGVAPHPVPLPQGEGTTLQRPCPELPLPWGEGWGEGAGMALILAGLLGVFICLTGAWFITSPFGAVQAFGIDPSHLADIALAPGSAFAIWRLA